MIGPRASRAGALLGLATLLPLLGLLPTAAVAAAATVPSGRSCHLDGVPHPALCASLSRPLDPARPDGPRFDLHYAVLPALARNKAPDPVVFFAGGPGQSAVDLAAAFHARFGRLNQWRDLVFIDQRGTGRSAPLRCPEDAPRAALAPLSQALDSAARLQRLAACRQTLQALPHGDLRFYATVLASGDVDAVRQALGAPRLNLVGGSYGTRAALDYLRQYPQRVRRVVLDGVAPPDMRLHETAGRDNEAALQAVWQACAAQPACQRRHPQLDGQMRRLLASLPRTVQLPHPVSGQLQSLTLDADLLRSLVRAPLYAPVLASALPEAIAEADAGRFAPLMALASALGGGAGGLATGQHFSVVCAEDLGPDAPAVEAASTPAPATASASASTTPAKAAGPTGAGTFGDSFAQLYRQVCADWPRAAVPAAFYTVPPAPASVAVWVLSGGADPVTPPRHGQRVAGLLGPRARHTVVAEAGHGVSGLPCVRGAVLRFITTEADADALAQDTAALAACTAAMPRPPLFRPPGLAPQEGSR